MRPLLIGLFLLALNPDQSEKIQNDIVQLKQHIAHVDSELSRLAKQQEKDLERKESLTERIPGMELKRATLKQERQKVELQIELIKAEKEQNRGDKQRVSGQIAELEQALGKRLRLLYKKGPLGYTQALLNEDAIEDLVLSLYYVEHLTKKDRVMLERFLELNRELKATEAKLLDLENSEKERLETLEEKKKEISELLNRRKREIAVLFKKSKEREALLNQLAEEKKELTELIGKLQKGELDESAIPPIPITHYKGRLDWPADGEVLRQFGVFRDAQFSTKRRQNGIDIAIKRGQDVKAVYGGQVIFADWFKSYGNLVILDHGRQYVTFYAHNENLLVKKGDAVERNQVIAQAGDSGSLEGPFLHFELRQSTKAEDPQKWLKKRKRRR